LACDIKPTSLKSINNDRPYCNSRKVAPKEKEKSDTIKEINPHSGIRKTVIKPRLNDILLPCFLKFTNLFCASIGCQYGRKLQTENVQIPLKLKIISGIHKSTMSINHQNSNK